MKENNSCIREQKDDNQIEQGKAILDQLALKVDYLSHSLSLVGNPVRLQILFLLQQEQQLCVCDLSDMLQMTLSAVSQHLRKLKDRNFLQTQRQGQTIYYSLTTEHTELMRFIFHYLMPTPHEKDN